MQDKAGDLGIGTTAAAGAHHRLLCIMQGHFLLNLFHVCPCERRGLILGGQENAVVSREEDCLRP